MMSDRTLLRRIGEWPKERVAELVGSRTAGDVDRALQREGLCLEDLAALLSPAAANLLEPMAREAQRLTRMHFGRTIGLYAPIYLSNVCTAKCPYCGFSGDNGGRGRVSLTMDELRRECVALSGAGFDSVLLLTGEAPKPASVDYIAEAVRVSGEYFSAVCVEVYALDYDGYRRLCDAGLEGVTLYMETYERETYERIHLHGMKRNYEHRLMALDRAGAAGARRLNLGALLGLYDWRVETFYMAIHARHLQQTCWRSTVAVSFPRLKNVPQGFAIPAPVSDAALVQLMLALRLFLPEAGFTLSTRENPEFRDRLIPLGITMMSAGSSTRPGGYASEAPSLEQFPTVDRRTPSEVLRSIVLAGYDPVWKDSDRAFYSL